MRGRTLELKVHWIYRIASLIATLEAFCLFILGLDLTLHQIILFCLFGFPASVAMYVLDRWLISRHVRPIQTAVEALDQSQPADPTIMAHADDPDRAVRAALAMVARLEALNMRLSSQSLPMLRIGVGIHTGEVIAGQIGPDTRVEYDVTGDAVNVASRIEGLTKEMRTTILISEATAARLGPGFTLGRAAELPVRGKEKPVKVVEVLGHPASCAPLGN